MKNRKGLLLIGAPLGAAFLLVVTASVLRSPEERGPRKLRKPRETVEAAPEKEVPAPPSVRYSRTAPPEPAAEDVLVTTAADARLRGTYKNFRTAVAKGSAPLVDALAKVLRRDREAAIALAEEELSKSRTARDREITRQTLNVLRRTP